MPTPFFADLVRELCQEGGTGPLTPNGAVPGHRRFADAVPADTEFHYAIAGVVQSAQWEVGLGRIDSGGRLIRTSVAASSQGGGHVDFAPGLKTIALTVGANWFAARETEAAALVNALAAKQPLSTTHAAAATGAADDLVTVRRGSGWVNLPLSILPFRDAAGRHGLNGALDAQNGTAAAPSVTFAADPDSGLFRAGANMIALTTGGSERLRVADTGHVGIGTNAPLARLAIRSSGEILRIETTVARGGGGAFQAWYDTSGRKGFLGYADASDHISLFNEMSGMVYFGTSGAARWAIGASGGFEPMADNSYAIGQSGLRTSVIYSATGAINTCDGREKANARVLNPEELAAAKRIAGSIGFFQWVTAIEEKGAGGARLHCGPIAQTVWAIMAEEGLIGALSDTADPDSKYAFLCWDRWDRVEAVEEVRDAAGQVIVHARPGVDAGSRFGVRPDQLALFLIAAQEQRLTAIEAMA